MNIHPPIKVLAAALLQGWNFFSFCEHGIKIINFLHICCVLIMYMIKRHVIAWQLGSEFPATRENVPASAACVLAYFLRP